MIRQVHQVRARVLRMIERAIGEVRRERAAMRFEIAQGLLQSCHSLIERRLTQHRCGAAGERYCTRSRKKNSTLHAAL